VFHFFKTHRDVLGVATVVPINKDFFISSPSAELKYFLESRPSTIQVDDPEWLSYKAIYTINDDSLNERFNYPIHKPVSVFRIVTLGDSFTFGHFVNTKDNWTEQFEDKLNTRCSRSGISKFEVINLGERGYDITYAAHKYDIRGRKYTPNLIIFLESGNGLTRVDELYEPLVNKYNALLTQKDISAAREHGEFNLAWTKAYEELRQKYTPEQVSEYVRNAWRELSQIKGSTPLVVVAFNFLSYEEKLKLLLWTRGFIDTKLFFGLPDIYDNGEVLKDGHPNVNGHTSIANSIISYLVDEEYITCH
jgi:hypothetical protein